jgi:hypothetical protein
MEYNIFFELLEILDSVNDSAESAYEVSIIDSLPELYIDD